MQGLGFRVSPKSPSTSEPYTYPKPCTISTITLNPKYLIIGYMDPLGVKGLSIFSEVSGSYPDSGYLGGLGTLNPYKCPSTHMGYTWTLMHLVWRPARTQ